MTGAHLVGGVAATPARMVVGLGQTAKGLVTDTSTTSLAIANGIDPISGVLDSVDQHKLAFVRAPDAHAGAWAMGAAIGDGTVAIFGLRGIFKGRGTACFTAETLVDTERGHTPIADIKREIGRAHV